MTAVLALSLSSEIEKYGAYAGIAAIAGLGVLALLYFAQAREVKRLREWAGRAPERDADLQQRAVTEAQRRGGGPAEPVRPAGPATPAAGGAAAASPPVGATPAAVPPKPGTPPAAQPGTPTGPKPPVPATAAAAGAAPAVTAAGTPAPAAPPKPAAATAAAAPPSATPAAKPPVSPPATPAGAATPAAAAAAAKPAAPAATPAQATPSPVPPPPPAPPRARPRPAAPPVRATRPDQTIPPRDAPRQPAEQGSHRGLLAVVLGGIAIAAVAVLLITQVFSGDDTPTTTRPNSVGTPTTPADTGGGGTAAKPQPARGTTRVAVFNGTTVTGLARAAADKLTAAGYKNVSPVTTDTTNQSRATTVVYWQSGSRREGVDVAKLIGVGKTALQPMDQNARVLGGGAPVVVIVGADQAQ